jgi:(1->4)-alpha-D-glucan 1-alpha-D-glucosylmutase
MHVPRATYRIQFTPVFGFREAGEILNYLVDLGISDLYASPIFKARRDSPHGYDVLDPTRINPSLGGRAGFEALATAATGFGLGWIQDVVPNHMAFDPQNTLLMDVLENGPRSRFAHFFDVEWDHPYTSIKRRLLSPFLGSFYGKSLESGEIRIIYRKTGFAVQYYDHQYPLRIESYARLLGHGTDRLERELGSTHPDYQNLCYILDNLEVLARENTPRERYRKVKAIKNTLWTLYANSEECKRFIDENVALFNGEAGKSESFNLLDQLLMDQHFRLSFWKVADEEINYRRFFNINQLISLRQENPAVFKRTHSLILELAGKGRFNGLRIDHIDGLYDPGRYLERIRENAPVAYVAVEKILEPGESIPGPWPVQGTTGYDFLNRLNGIFCRRSNGKAFTSLYARFTGLKTPYPELKREKKRLILEMHMAGDIDNLALLLKTVSSRDRYAGDITMYGLKNALLEVMTAFPVYRTYIAPDLFRDEDGACIRQAVEKARAENPDLENELGYIERILLLAYDAHLTEEERRGWMHFVMRFQQFTGPLTAKGLEDTVFYVYNRLISLNEVGGDPGSFGTPLDAFHAFNADRAEGCPHAMNTTATHDTKRGEDVRARINVLSEMPREWADRIKKWSRINRKYKRRAPGGLIPDRNDELLLYQTLIGAYPFGDFDGARFIERIREYAIKAVREAKVHTHWLKPDNAYEEGFLAFIDRILDPAGYNPFLHDFIPFQRRIAHYGVFNSLSQVLLKIASPGIPDFYQGTELWDFSLVDPDNRRPVDFEIRKNALAFLRQGSGSGLATLIRTLLVERSDGRIKLFLIYRTLQARKRHEALFREGAYLPLEAAGAFKDHAIALARRLDRVWAVILAPRFLTELVKEGEDPLGKVWQDTRIKLPEHAPEEWMNPITEQRIRARGEIMLGDALKDFPAALLVAGDRI